MEEAQGPIGAVAPKKKMLTCVLFKLLIRKNVANMRKGSDIL
jgi:hypothetical protein